MKKIVAADIETDPFKYMEIPECFSVGFYDGEIYRDFWGENAIKEFMYFIVVDYDHDDIIIYIHNGGRYDFHFMLRHFDEELKIINGSIVKATIGNIEFRDSYLILPLPLSAHKKDEIDYDDFTKDRRNKPKIKKKIRAYQKSDCIYLYEWVDRFITDYGQAMTLPSASFQQLKATGYEIKRTGEYYDSIFRPFYYGGRTEVFEGGVHRGEIQYYDINSAYPYAMLSKHPFGNRYVVLDDLPSRQPYFARVFAASYGAAPFRTETGLFFPNDGQIREYYLTGWEICAGLRTGTLDIAEVIEVYQHEQAFSFKKFVNKFYKKKLSCKLEGDKDGETFAKLILNSAYGKFALNPREFEKYFLTKQGEIPEELVLLYIKYGVDKRAELVPKIYKDESLDEDSAKLLVEKVLSYQVVNDTVDGLTVWCCKDPSFRFYNVATAASITGFVRSMLWETICSCDRPLYCDTDSVMCYGFKGNISNELGDWKLEDSLPDLYLGGKKLYAGRIKGKQMHYRGKGEVSRDNEHYNKWLKKNWKIASKGSQLTHLEIMDIVENDATVTWKKAAPAFSLRFGARFIEREIKRTY